MLVKNYFHFVNSKEMPKRKPTQTAADSDAWFFWTTRKGQVRLLELKFKPTC